jgi:GAF domain-containing protein
MAAVVAGESDIIANLANIAAILKEIPGYFWTGFYLVKNEELVLGPFQGPVACTRIRKGRGVCGEAWFEKKSMLVPDVDLHPGHITCNPLSRSEMVTPVYYPNGTVFAIIDVDSDELNALDEKDLELLEEVAKIVASLKPVST